MIYCPVCGTANQESSHSCTECGEPLPGTVRCPMCSSVNPAGNVFCDECNARLSPMSSAPEDQTEERQPQPARELFSPPIPSDEGDEAQGEGRAPDSQENSTSGDWLDDLRSSASEEDYLEPDDISDFPDDPSGEDDLEPIEIPDWLREMGPVRAGPQSSPEVEPFSPAEASEEKAAPEGGPPEEPPLEAADIPEWLREFAPREVDTEAEEVPFLDDDVFLEPPEFPDWLPDVEAVEGDAPAPSIEEPVAAEESPPPAPAEPPTAPPAPQEDRMPEEVEEADDQAEPEWEEIPAWLREIAPSLTQVEGPPEPGETAPEEPVSTLIQIPDWLKESIETGVEPSPGERTPEEELFSAEQPPQVRIEAGEEAPPETLVEPAEFSTWFQERVGEGEERPPEEHVVPSEERPPEAPEIPAWLTELLAEEPTVTDEVSPIPAETAFDEDELEAALQRAHIPEWLQDLRPSDAEDQQAVRGPLETEGLLKGLRGLLPASPAIEAPLTYEGPSGAVTSEASLARAELLQSLLGQPTARAKPEPSKRKAGIDLSVVRLLVATFLLLAVLIMLLAPLVMRQPPRLTQPVATSGASQLYDVVGELGAGDDVLVAFDYGPLESDELNVVARPVLEHVIDQGADVTIVSTRADGPLVASSLMSQIVDSPDQYTLLIYRPGAATAISQFLTGAVPSPTMLLVLTSRAAPLRRWVEQARAHYGDQLTMTLAGSAALEPAASPYLDASAGQLAGSIHGLKGAAAYEALREAGGDATQRLNALAAGHLAIVSLIIAGAIFYGLNRAQEGSE